MSLALNLTISQLVIKLKFFIDYAKYIFPVTCTVYVRQRQQMWVYAYGVLLCFNEIYTIIFHSNKCFFFNKKCIDLCINTYRPCLTESESSPTKLLAIARMFGE